MSADPNRSLRASRHLLMIGVLLVLLFAGVPAALALALHDSRPGSELWTDAERSMLAEVEALMGPSQNALAASERLVGPELSIPRPPIDAEVYAVTLEVDLGPKWQDHVNESGDLSWLETLDLTQLLRVEGSLEEVALRYEGHFPRRVVETNGSIEFRDLGRYPERSIQLAQRGEQVTIDYRWQFFLEDHERREVFVDRFGRWFEPPPALETWNFDTLFIWYLPFVSDYVYVAASVEPTPHSRSPWDTGVKVFAMGLPFPVRDLVVLIVVVVAVAIALWLIRRWGRVIRSAP